MQGLPRKPSRTSAVCIRPRVAKPSRWGLARAKLTGNDRAMQGPRVTKRMSDLEPTDDHRAAAFADRVKDFRHASRPPAQPPTHTGSATANAAEIVSFDRIELREILNLYGRKVAEGEWRDYAIDFTPQKAVFSIYRRNSECPLYRIEKNPKLAKKQGAYSVLAANGLTLKRGHELSRVVAVLDKRLKLVSG
jgi:Protein of unknown function (DUF2794)